MNVLPAQPIGIQSTAGAVPILNEKGKYVRNILLMFLHTNYCTYLLFIFLWPCPIKIFCYLNFILIGISTKIA